MPTDLQGTAAALSKSFRTPCLRGFIVVPAPGGILLQVPVTVTVTVTVIDDLPLYHMHS